MNFSPSMLKLLNRIENPVVVHAGIAALVVAYGFVRAVAFSGLSGDEAEQVLFAQSFQWGYDVANPPLYTWILIALFSLFGKSAVVVISLKYVVLAAVYSALYWAARVSLTPSRRLDCALVALSPLLIFFVSWHSIFSFSHSLLNAFLVVLCFIAFIRLVERGTLLGYAVFGITVGLGVLTKYSFLMFVFGFMAAGLSLDRLRPYILSPKIILSIIVAGGIAAPHVVWLVAASEQVQEAVNYKLQLGSESSYLSGVAKGLWNLLRAAFAFMSPLWLVALLVFPALMKKTSPTFERPVVAALLGRTFAVIAAIMVCMVVIGGVTQFRPNYLFLMVLFPLWVFARIPAEQMPGKRRQIYGALLVVGAVSSVGGLVVKAVADPLTCKKCQFLVPYGDMARAFQKLGFEKGTLFATWHPNPLPGNLALHLDGARVVSSKFPALKPPKTSSSNQCLMVWAPQKSGGGEIRNWAGLVNKAFGTNIQANTPFQEISFPVFRKPESNFYLNYILLDPGVGECR